MFVVLSLKPLQFLLILGALSFSPASAQWTKASIPFEATAITRNGDAFWVCGPNAAIASSSDGGSHWVVRNEKPAIGTLLSIGWANEKFGFAAGTTGLLVVTMDSGASWQQVPTALTDPILAVSFADRKHGMIVTTSAVLYTNNGGEGDWKTVLSSAVNPLPQFKFVLEIAALDPEHSQALMKLGPAQYYDGRLVSTSDGGATWKTHEIEHTTLNNLLIVNGEFWLVGTEVIEREKRGGHAVPVTFHSPDGIDWKRGPKPPTDTNTACRPEGCLMRNGVWVNPFMTSPAMYSFPNSSGLTPQWSATSSRICALAPDLECADAVVTSIITQEGPPPPLAASELRPAAAMEGGACIRCDYPHTLISQKLNGKVNIQLTILVRPDGSVSSAEPNSGDEEIGSKVARAAHSWIFYPLMRDGKAVAVRRTVKLEISVVKLR